MRTAALDTYALQGFPVPSSETATASGGAGQRRGGGPRDADRVREGLEALPYRGERGSVLRRGGPCRTVVGGVRGGGAHRQLEEPEGPLSLAGGGGGPGLQGGSGCCCFVDL